MTNKTPDFQETLKRMLSSPPKENKPLNADGGRINKPKKFIRADMSEGVIAKRTQVIVCFSENECGGRAIEWAEVVEFHHQKTYSP